MNGVLFPSAPLQPSWDDGSDGPEEDAVARCAKPDLCPLSSEACGAYLSAFGWIHDVDVATVVEIPEDGIVAVDGQDVVAISGIR